MNKEHGEDLFKFPRRAAVILGNFAGVIQTPILELFEGSVEIAIYHVPDKEVALVMANAWIENKHSLKSINQFIYDQNGRQFHR